MNKPSRIFVIGASAGGFEALRTLVCGIPRDFPAAILAVVHVPAETSSRVVQALRHHGSILVEEAIDGGAIRSGCLYLGPPDRHLLVDHAVMRLTRGPKENRSRPAVDTLFRSAACTRGAHTVGVVLTGEWDDGTAGLRAIKDRGGITVVQSPVDAPFPSMPQSALQQVSADYVVELAAIPTLLMRLARECDRMFTAASSADMRTEVNIAAGEESIWSGDDDLGHPTRFTCPDCHGVLSEICEGANKRFRCHTGHAYSMRTLLAVVDETIEHELWSVLRTMHERVMLLRRAGNLARQFGEDSEAEMIESRTMGCEEQARTIHGLLQNSSPGAGGVQPSV